MKRTTNAFGQGRDRQRGVTLIELMIVVVIMAIIASVAYPSYNNFIVKSKRTAAKTIIMRIADRQEQFFADNKQYAADLTDLGFAANPFAVNQNGEVTDVAADDRIYLLGLANTSATTYTIGAIPQLSMIAGDADCGIMWMTHTGDKGNSGTSTDCW